MMMVREKGRAESMSFISEHSVRTGGSLAFPFPGSKGMAIETSATS